PEVPGRPYIALAPSRRVDQLVAGDCHEPGLRVSRDPALGPFAQGAGEGLRKRIFGSGDVAGPGGKKSNELAIALPGHRLGGLVGPLVAPLRHRTPFSTSARSDELPPRRDWRPGNGPPRTRRRRDPGLRRCNSLRAAPWFRHRGH